MRVQPRWPAQCLSLARTLASCEAVWTLAASVPALAAGCRSAVLHAQGQARARARRHHGSRRPRQARRHGHHCPGLLHGARRQPSLHAYAAPCRRCSACAPGSVPRRSVSVWVCPVSRRSALARPRCALERRGASATGGAACARARPLRSRFVLAPSAEGVTRRVRARQETLLIDKPLRLVGLPAQDLWGRARRGVVLQTGRPLAVMCNARCAGALRPARCPARCPAARARLRAWRPAGGAPCASVLGSLAARYSAAGRRASSEPPALGASRAAPAAAGVPAPRPRG